MSTLEASVPVAEVTVFEDRAQVMRRGLVHFPVGRSSIVIDGVAPTLVDKTLAVQVLGPINVTSVKIVRPRPDFTVDDADPPEATPSPREGDALAAIAERLVERLERDVARGTVDVDRWISAWNTIDAAVGEKQLAPTAEPSTSRPTIPIVSIRVEFEASDSGPYPVQVDYVVPNATWRPHYRIEVERGEPDRALVDVGAFVWQHTGEDWSDAVLCLSTQRISRGQKPPDLSTDYVSVRSRSASAPDPTGVQSALPEPVASALMPDDHGRWIPVTVRDRVSVPSSERGVRVAIERLSPEANVALVCGPGSERAQLMVRFRNEGERPLLSGPVELLANGGWCGRSAISYAGTDEPCELAWVPDQSVRVTHKVHVSEPESRLMSARVRTSHRVEIKLSNLADTARRVEIRELLPASDERTRVTIAYDDGETPQPNDDGALRWHVELAPQGQHQIAFGYVIETNQRTSIEAS